MIDPPQQDPAKIVHVAIGLALRTGRQPALGAEAGIEVLVTRRPAHTVYAGYWEFPGGKIHPGESAAQCLVREFLEEVALHVQPVRELPAIEHIYPHAHVHLHPFECRVTAGHVQHLQVSDHRWVAPADLHHFAFPEANAPLIEHLIARHP